MDEGTLNDLLECSVCLERLDTSSKVLPCQHTFCKKCLDEIVQKHKELKCPECRVLVTVRVDDLPPNVLLMRILEGMKNAPNFHKQRNGRGGNVQQALLHHTVHHSVNIPEQIIASNKLNSAQVHHQPYAKALYDYAAKEVGDLTFKRGDVIILKRRIDSNWYHGECNGQQGVFPLSYVQIITPVPSHLPQCKALYDFRMTNDEEEGCLAFKKGDVINVIRRVDENWAEGKLDGKIGIFPLAFVELNNLARSLMKLSTNAQPGPSKVAPPTPTNEDITPLIPTDHSKVLIPQPQPKPVSTVSKTLPTSDSSSTISSGSSSTTTPIVSSSNTSSSSSTAPSSPASPPSRAQGTPSRNFPQIPDLVGRSSATSTPQRTPPGSQPIAHSKEKRHSFTGVSHPQHNPLHRLSAEIVGDSSLSGSPRRINGDAQLPAAYIALFPYKPQKPDELELKKGGIYMVTDRCQDGWYKGTSNRTQKCGVFPGNYVSLARGLTPAQIESKSSVSRIRGGKNGLSKSLGAPPELPPRAVSPSAAPSISSSWHGQQEGVAAPLGRSTSAILPGSAQVLASATSTKSTDKSKERKERSAAMSLMKRLANMKPPKSPPNSYSMDNPVFEDASTASTTQPIHVRSGSCPSQLLQVHSADHHRFLGSSQRLKHKDRPSVLPSHRSLESTAGSSSPEVNRHRKSNSLDAGNKTRTATQTVRERYRCITPYPPNSEYELELHVGDIIYVHKKRDDGWYKGTQQRTGKTGLFPATFVEGF
ncbi:hypothetical protein HHI36_011296 [Cryptolaemus montrouzieri]|uniref:RING-type E3 ubiquitin transferase n=1 Tax=Cryptolaemus montrouzieri TaxID=559131 RepID=A0ABD2ML97_9CUCU